jgi:CRP-like cAMP-binding protein
VHPIPTWAHVQVAVVVSGEISLFVRRPEGGTSMHVLDLVHLDFITAGPLTPGPEPCSAVAKSDAKVMLIGVAAFREFLSDAVCSCSRA